MKIIIITNMPSPYRIPLFNHLREDFEQRGWHLKVIFLTRGYARRKWNINENEITFDYEYLNDIQFTFGEGFMSLALSLPKLLNSEKPDIIIVGGFSISTLWVFLYSRLYDIPYIIWSGETPRQSKSRKDLFNLRFFFRKFMVSRSFAGVAYGTEAKNYLTQMGLPRESIFIGINTVDTHFFQQACMNIKKNKENIKTEKGFPIVNILYVGHLTKLKGIDYLIKALHRIRNNMSHVALHIVGDGNYHDTLVKMVRDLDMSKQVYFWGFKQKDDLPLYYGIADFFVFPSFYDVWGLVCIEAMSAYLPVLSSSFAGVSVDLIKDGVNGFTIDPYNEIDLCSRIEQLIKDSDLRHRLGMEAGKTITENYMITHSAQGFVDAIRYSKKTMSGQPI